MCNRFASVVVLALLAAGAALAQTEVADIVLVNGLVFTSAQGAPADAIAIKGTRILDVGSNDAILATAGARTRRINLDKRLVVPGLSDTHTHFVSDPIGLRLDFGSGEPSCGHVLDVVQQAVRTHPAGTVLSGDMGTPAFFDAACTAAALDRIAPNHPVVLGAFVHGGMVNRAAAARFGVRTGDPPPLAGFYGKDMKSTYWDGIVHESAWFAIADQLFSDQSHDVEKLRRWFDRQARLGVTSTTIMEVHPPRRVGQLATVNPRVRVRLVPFQQFQDGPRRRIPAYPTIPKSLVDRVSVSGEKWSLDGSPFERSAAMRAPYADDPTVSGELDFPPDQIRGILTDALQRNHQLLIHAVGDRAAEALLQAMEATGGQAAWSGRRLRIEHGDGLMPDLVPRAKALGVIVAQNPTHFGGDLGGRRFGAERASRMLPFRSLLEAGIPLVIATDGGPDDDLSSNPYENIRLASTYQDRPDDAITREQALTAFTRTAAYSEFAERDRGTLEPGTLADLAVLSQNILSVADEALPKTESVLTMVGGEIVYRSPLVASVDPLTPPAAAPASDTAALRATDEVLESRRFSLFDLF